jgi:hypothetical protein
MRLIEQLGAVLGAFVSCTAVSGLQTEDTQGMIEESCRRALGLSYATIREMSPEHLVELLRAGGGTWMDRCFLAGILHEYDAENLAALRGRGARQGIGGAGPLSL